MNPPISTHSWAPRVGRALRFPLIVCLALGVWGAPARAQVPPAIDRLEVAIWPEYDRAAVLVIYRVDLSPETDLPTQLTLPIPASAGEPSAVASRTAAGDLLVANSTRQVEGEWANLTIDVDEPGAQVEYYVDLETAGSQRRYTFTWPGGVEVGTLAYEVQQPFGVSDLGVTPSGASSVRPDGLTYIQADLGPQSASSSLDISITYSKSTPGLTIDALQPTGPLEPAATGGGASVGLSAWLPWVGGAAGVLLLAGGALWYWRANQVGARERSRPRRRRARAQPSPSGEIDASPVFCHNCGAQAGVSDHFCRRCGTRLRQ
jgi:hypothetical protein